MSGQWEVKDGVPYWVWSYANGKADAVSVIDVVWASTKQSDRDLFNQEIIKKVDQVYDHFKLPHMEEHKFMHELEIRSLRWAPWLKQTHQLQ